MRRGVVSLIAAAVIATVGIAKPVSMNGALNAWEHLAAKMANLH